MPQFYAGETRTARVTMRNPTGKGFSYQAAVILGLPEIARSEQSFAIPSGEEKIIGFPLTIPSVAGTHPVHVHVSSGGESLAIYRATEDVTILEQVVQLTVLSGNGGWNADVLDPTRKRWLRGEYSPATSGLAPDWESPSIATPSLSFQILSKKFLLNIMSDGWPIIYTYVYGPYLVEVPNWGAYTYNVKTSSMTGPGVATLTQIPAVTNGVIVYGRCVSTMNYLGVSGVPTPFLLTVEVESCSDIAGKLAFSEYLPSRIQCWATARNIPYSGGIPNFGSVYPLKLTLSYQYWYEGGYTYIRRSDLIGSAEPT